MKANNAQALSVKKFRIIGFEGDTEVTIEITLSEIMYPCNDDSELLYTLQDMYFDRLCELPHLGTMCIQMSRNDQRLRGVVMRTI